MKTCSKCGEEKPLSVYYRQHDGRMAECKECFKARARRNYHKNGDEHRAKKRAYRAANLERERERTRIWQRQYPELKRAFDRDWRERNKERKAISDKAWAEANRERVREIKRTWENRHPDLVRANSWVQGQKRRGKKPSAETNRFRREVLVNDPCAYCGGPTEEADHIIPRNDWHVDAAGWNEWSNLTASCQSCNRHKADRSLLTFLLV